MGSHSEGLSRKHLRAFPREVSSALIFLVEHGVRYRMTDGVHILLYPVDGVSQPFKVSAHRSATASLHFIRDFCESNQLEEP